MFPHSILVITIIQLSNIKWWMFRWCSWLSKCGLFEQDIEHITFENNQSNTSSQPTKHAAWNKTNNRNQRKTWKYKRIKPEKKTQLVQKKQLVTRMSRQCSYVGENSRWRGLRWVPGDRYRWRCGSPGGTERRVHTSRDTGPRSARSDMSSTRGTRHWWSTPGGS